MAFNISVPAKMMIAKLIRKNGYRYIPNLEAIRPKSGGMKVLPRYALAIWIPTTDCEFSRPKLSGVE